VESIKTSDIRRFRRIVRAFERETERELKDPEGCCGISLSQCHTLMELSECGEVSLTDLAALLGLDKSTLSRVVENMRSSGLVERIENESDRRYIRLRLSKTGTEAAAGIHAMCDRYYGSILERIPREKLGVVFEGFSLVAGALESSGCPCCKPKGVEEDIADERE
jgi:DNA-binding MarR family transcriptional regulator